MTNLHSMIDPDHEKDRGSHVFAKDTDEGSLSSCTGSCSSSDEAESYRSNGSRGETESGCTSSGSSSGSLSDNASQCTDGHISAHTPAFSENSKDTLASYVLQSMVQDIVSFFIGKKEKSPKKKRNNIEFVSCPTDDASDVSSIANDDDSGFTDSDNSSDDDDSDSASEKHVTNDETESHVDGKDTGKDIEETGRNVEIYQDNEAYELVSIDADLDADHAMSKLTEGSFHEEGPTSPTNLPPASSKHDGNLPMCNHRSTKPVLGKTAVSKLVRRVSTFHLPTKSQRVDDEEDELSNIAHDHITDGRGDTHSNAESVPFSKEGQTERSHEFEARPTLGMTILKAVSRTWPSPTRRRSIVPQFLDEDEIELGQEPNDAVFDSIEEAQPCATSVPNTKVSIDLTSYSEDDRETLATPNDKSSKPHLGKTMSKVVRTVPTLPHSSKARCLLDEEANEVSKPSKESTGEGTGYSQVGTTTPCDSKDPIGTADLQSVSEDGDEGSIKSKGKTTKPAFGKAMSKLARTVSIVHRSSKSRDAAEMLSRFDEKESAIEERRKDEQSSDHVQVALRETESTSPGIEMETVSNCNERDDSENPSCPSNDVCMPQVGMSQQDGIGSQTMSSQQSVDTVTISTRKTTGISTFVESGMPASCRDDGSMQASLGLKMSQVLCVGIYPDATDDNDSDEESSQERQDTKKDSEQSKSEDEHAVVVTTKSNESIADHAVIQEEPKTKSSSLRAMQRLFCVSHRERSRYQRAYGNMQGNAIQPETTNETVMVSSRRKLSSTRKQRPSGTNRQRKKDKRTHSVLVLADAQTHTKLEQLSLSRKSPTPNSNASLPSTKPDTIEKSSAGYRAWKSIKTRVGYGAGASSRHGIQVTSNIDDSNDASPVVEVDLINHIATLPRRSRNRMPLATEIQRQDRIARTVHRMSKSRSHATLTSGDQPLSSS